MAKLYPIHVNINLHITDGDSDGAVNYGFAMGRLPTEEDMGKVIEECMTALPSGFRLMTRHESLIYYLRQEKGYRGPNNVAMPGIKDGDEWHDPSTANCYMPSDEDDFEGDE